MTLAKQIREYSMIDRPAIDRDLHRAMDLAEGGEWADAHEVLTTVRASLAAVGTPSAFVSWTASITADYLGDFEGAIEAVFEALDLDPWNFHVRRSREIICRRTREWICAPDRDLGDPRLWTLYERLLDHGEADRQCHLRAVKHLAEVGRTGDALDLAQAVLMLDPTFAEVRDVRASIAGAWEVPTGERAVAKA